MLTNNSLAQIIASEFSQLPQVIAIALAGSQSTKANNLIDSLDELLLAENLIDN